MSEIVDKHVLKRYDIHSKVGKGAYGIVFKAKDRKTGKTVAVKKVYDAFLNITDAQRTFREIMILQQLKHDNIIPLIDIMKADNDRDFYIVFPFVSTDLHAVVRTNILENIHKKYILYQLLLALAYIHSGELLHRDLKPSNILINSDCIVRLCDFGLARSLACDSSSSKPESAALLTDYVATRWYRAPEILLGVSAYTSGIDMWSLGCLFGELLTGKPLFPGSSTLNQLTRIINMTGHPSEEDLKEIGSPFARTMLDAIPTTAPKSTPFVQWAKTGILPSIASDPALNKRFSYCTPSPMTVRRLALLIPSACPETIDILARLLSFSPSHRLQAEDALHHPFVAVFSRGEGTASTPSISLPVAPYPLLLRPISLPLSDGVKYSVEEYRQKVYECIRKRKRRKERHGLSRSGSSFSSGSRSSLSSSSTASLRSSHSSSRSTHSRSTLSHSSSSSSSSVSSSSSAHSSSR
ncbi:Extracellular signal-regulated kinase 2, partial [Aduncisulcus paluster]